MDFGDFCIEYAPIIIALVLIFKTTSTALYKVLAATLLLYGATTIPTMATGTRTILLMLAAVEIYLAFFSKRATNN